MSVKQALEQRAKIKQRKPAYDREDLHKIMALRGTGWRKPTGLHSKMRARKRGQPALLEPGYGSPKEVYGMHPTGLYTVVVNTLEELKLVNPKTHGVVLAAGLGMKKKIAIIQKAEEQKLRILNIRKPSEYVANAQKVFSERKQARAATKVVVKEKPEQKKPEATPEVQEPASEKKELDKLLTKREA